ncbi:uncharacterized protein LOC114137885 [Xiphophorus couchianus]|uniref:uncharacterized protein LOC114137885 n=1 Tax=Xiphophorus couchianus TaxID=32473 RepID=UPI00101720BE|nr:uncharacterized protein LOC114137885 [Xiphophorus couchianus]
MNYNQLHVKMNILNDPQDDYVQTFLETNPVTLAVTEMFTDRRSYAAVTVLLPTSQTKLYKLPANPYISLYKPHNITWADVGNRTKMAVEATDFKEAERISSTHSAQAAELIALTRACELAKDKHLTVYTDSQYVFSTLFYFAKQWERRGMTTSTGRPITHASLLKDLLQAIQLPTKLAVCKCAAHTKSKDEVSNGNRLADKIAKEAAAGKHGKGIFSAQTEGEQQMIDKTVLKDMQDNAPQAEKRLWITKGAKMNVGNIFEVNDKPVLPKSLFKAAAIVSHGRCHVSTGGMETIIKQHFTTYGLNSYLKSFCTACPVCVKYNPQGNIRPKRGRFPKSSYPFQTMHMDFIELSQSGPYKYCLVMIDAFSKWVEIVPAKHADALTVAKAICKTIIPTHGIPQTVYSDNGPHFVNRVIQNMATHLGMTLKNHCAYHPQSAGLVERTNATVKSRLRKCMADTGRSWPECLDLVKLYMRITSTADGLTPFEIIHGRAYRLPLFATDIQKADEEQTLADYMIRTLKLKEVSSANLLPSDSPPIQEAIPLEPGDWVYIKVIKRKNWTSPRWEGPFQDLIDLTDDDDNIPALPGSSRNDEIPSEQSGEEDHEGSLIDGFTKEQLEQAARDWSPQRDRGVGFHPRVHSTERSLARRPCHEVRGWESYCKQHYADEYDTHSSEVTWRKINGTWRRAIVSGRTCTDAILGYHLQKRKSILGLPVPFIPNPLVAIAEGHAFRKNLCDGHTDPGFDWVGPNLLYSNLTCEISKEIWEKCGKGSDQHDCYWFETLGSAIVTTLTDVVEGVANIVEGGLHIVGQWLLDALSLLWPYILGLLGVAVALIVGKIVLEVVLN